MKDLAIFTFLFLLTINIQAQNCFELIEDNSGINQQEHQAELEAAACELIAVLPTAYQDSFKVFDFGFYRHQEYFEGGFDPFFEQAKALAGKKSPYYLLFGKESNMKGIYDKFWVDLKLPGEQISLCLDDANKNILKQLTDNKVNELHKNNDKNPYQYYKAEIEAMSLFKKELDKRINCCQQTAEGLVIDCRLKETDCFNGLDDDGDGLIDCEDLDCFKEIYGINARNNPQAKARFTECVICPVEKVEMIEQIKNELLYQIEDSNDTLNKYWNKLKKIQEMYARCSTSNWESYKDKGIVPQCLWEKANPGIAFQSGIIDGVYGETKAIIDFIVEYEKNLTTIAGILMQMSVAVNRDYYGCDDEEKLCNYSELVEKVKKEIACTLTCDEIEIAKNSIFKEENILKGCELLEELKLGINNISEFIENEEEMTKLREKFNTTISSIITKIQTGDTETAYRAGEIAGIIGLELIPISSISKAAKTKQVLTALKNLTPNQVSNLVDYIDNVIRGVIKLPDDDIKYAFDGDGILIFRGPCSIGGGFRSIFASERSVCRRLAKIEGGKIIIYEPDGLKLIFHEGISKRQLARVDNSNVFSATEVQKKALKLDLKEIGHLTNPITGNSIKQLTDNIVSGGDIAAQGALTEELTDFLFTYNGYTKLASKYGPNKGFDGVYVKYGTGGNVEDIILAEAKQMNQGKVKLRKAGDSAGVVGLHNQMSNGWIHAVWDELEDSGGLEAATALLMQNFTGKIRKIVVAVDKGTSSSPTAVRTGEFNILNFGFYP